MGRRPARKIAATYEFDLVKTIVAATKGPSFILTATLSGKLLVQDTRQSSLTGTVKD
ncbi:MAG: hypothetical protein ACJAUP_001656 [Cellvibrionaceae bacterium]|jgi:hypothetical protein